MQIVVKINSDMNVIPEFGCKISYFYYIIFLYTEV